jgi:hypothetical protein
LVFLLPLLRRILPFWISLNSFWLETSGKKLFWVRVMGVTFFFLSSFSSFSSSDSSSLAALSAFFGDCFFGDFLVSFSSFSSSDASSSLAALSAFFGDFFGEDLESSASVSFFPPFFGD